MTSEARQVMNEVFEQAAALSPDDLEKVKAYARGVASGIAIERNRREEQAEEEEKRA